MDCAANSTGPRRRSRRGSVRRVGPCRLTQSARQLSTKVWKTHKCLCPTQTRSLTMTLRHLLPDGGRLLTLFLKQTRGPRRRCLDHPHKSGHNLQTLTTTRMRKTWTTLKPCQTATARTHLEGASPKHRALRSAARHMTQSSQGHHRWLQT